MRDPIFSEILTRLQGVEDAIKKKEEALTKGINAFTEMVVSVLVEEWQLALQEQKRAQEEQEKRYLAAMKLLLEQSVQTGEKPDSGQPASWLGRLFDNK